jgi:trehalose synthase
MARRYWETLWKNKDLVDTECGIITIHDPQPAGFVDFLKKPRKIKIIWRCHIHLETFPHHIALDFSRFMKDTVEKYNAAIFSTFEFLPLWNVPSFVVPPFIEPLSEKNKELTQHEIEKVLGKYEIDTHKPLVTQISRFDKFKDPLGVIEAFKLVHDKLPCQLLLAGGSAADDPEYKDVLKKVQKKAEGLSDIHVINLPPEQHTAIEINAFQRASSIIIQKSIKEGFGLTVTESLWKGKPVIGGNVGGIKLQIKNGWNGFLITNVQETAEKMLYLLRHPEDAKKMGERGKNFVKDHFLITRGVEDRLKICNQLVKGKIISKNTILSFHPWCGVS